MPVRLAGTLLDGKRGYEWEFLRWVRNTATDAEWLEVRGTGKKNYGVTRSFKPDQVQKEQTPEPRIKTCAQCGRTGNKLFVKRAGDWVCKNINACYARRGIE